VSRKLISTLLLALILTFSVIPAIAEVTVYVTNTGKKYHEDGCRYLKQSKIPISLSDAKEQGYAPCSVCARRGDAPPDEGV
jgi:hypothetical protein